MTSSTQPKDRPSLDEAYALASSTSDLGLPHGPGAGAQGILAAAAWSEVHLGSDLRRLRNAWDSNRPHKKAPRPASALKAAGMTRIQAKRQHNRELVQCALTYQREKRALKLRIPEYAQVLDGLMARAVSLGIEDADTKALAVLDRWLENPERCSGDVEEARLWEYLRGCMNEAKVALQRGMRGQTKHAAEREELDDLRRELGLD